MYEARHHAPLSTSSFLQRMVGHGVAAILLLAVSLGAGILGYMH